MRAPYNTRTEIRKLEESEIGVFHCFSSHLFYSFLFHLSFSTRKTKTAPQITYSKSQKTLTQKPLLQENVRGKEHCLAYLNRLSPINNCSSGGTCDTIQLITASMEVSLQQSLIVSLGTTCSISLRFSILICKIGIIEPTTLNKMTNKC